MSMSCLSECPSYDEAHIAGFQLPENAAILLEKTIIFLQNLHEESVKFPTEVKAFVLVPSASSKNKLHFKIQQWVT